MQPGQLTQFKDFEPRESRIMTIEEGYNLVKDPNNKFTIANPKNNHEVFFNSI